MSSEYEDNEIKRKLGIAQKIPLQRAVRQVMRIAEDESHIQDAAEEGVSKESFSEYCSLLAKGMQWTNEHYPEHPGPKFVFFGTPGNQVNVEGATITFQDVIMLARRQYDEVYVLVPYYDVQLYQRNKISEITGEARSKSRKILGKLTADESAFLAGVEEAYHAVQHQDPQLRARLDAEEKQLQTKEGATDLLFSSGDIMQELNDSTPISEHDLKPRERNAAPVLKKAVEEYRSKKAQIEKS